MPRANRRDGAAKCWAVTVQLDQENLPGALFWHNWAVARCRDPADALFDVQGYVFQLEAGEEDGRKHWQMHLKFKERKRLAWFYSSGMFEYNGVTGFHATVARDENDSWKYAQKEDTRLAGPYAFGPRRLWFCEDACCRVWLPHDADDDSVSDVLIINEEWLSSEELI